MDMKEENRLVAGVHVSEILFPYKVYEDTGFITPEGTTLLTLEAGFREKENAELYIRIKAEVCDKKYIVRSSDE